MGEPVIINTVGLTSDDRIVVGLYSLLMCLKTNSSPFQDLDYDGSL